MQDRLGRDFKKGDLQQIEDDGGPTAACMRGWFYGRTRRPQSATIEAAGRAAGLMRVWVPFDAKKK